MIHFMNKSKSILSTGVLSLAVLSTSTITWSQPGAVDTQTRPASELEAKNNGNSDCVESVLKQKSKATPHYCLDVESIIGDESLSPWVHGMEMKDDDLAIDLDRNMSEYLVATLDREVVEFSNQEN